jgi:hypothetical protein
MSQVDSLTTTVKISDRLDPDTVDNVSIIQFFHASAKMSRILGAKGHTLY